MVSDRKKLFGILFITALCFFLYTYILPKIVFKYNFYYKNFIFHSTEPIEDSIKYVLSNSQKNLKQFDFNLSGFTQDIYLCNNKILFTIYAFGSFNAFAVNNNITNNIFIADASINSNTAYRQNNGKVYHRKLSEIIAHETTHTLVQKKTGLIRSTFLPAWINEGTCEVVAKGVNDNDSLLRANFLQTSFFDKNSEKYAWYYMCVNFLMVHKGYTVDSVLVCRSDFDSIKAETKEFYKIK